MNVYYNPKTDSLLVSDSKNYKIGQFFVTDAWKYGVYAEYFSNAKVGDIAEVKIKLTKDWVKVGKL